MKAKPVSWHDMNQQYMAAALAEVRGYLETPADNVGATSRRSRPPAASKGAASGDAAPSLEELCRTFGLSTFERAVLLMCAGMELDAAFAQAVARARGGPVDAAPTFGLALGALPGAHWSALNPAAPLRRWRFVDVLPGDTLVSSPLRIDERVLHFLVGVSYLDERLRPLLEPIETVAMTQSQHETAASITEALTSDRNDPVPPVHLRGEDRLAARAIAAGVCAQIGLRLFAVSADLLPAGAIELDTFARLMQREMVLGGCGLLISSSDDGRPTHVGTSIARTLEALNGCVFIHTSADTASSSVRSLTIELEKPTRVEQRAVWERSLGQTATLLNGQLDSVVAQFDLTAEAIEHACVEAQRQMRCGVPAADAVWQACRRRARAGLDRLAHRLVPCAGWDDLVLPEAQRRTLREIAVHVRQRATVYETWGFRTKGLRGLGISALFSGPSGTGKTMAAEVLAGELDLDLYHVDLSQIVSKYIGETEKNLARVFDAAESSGAILLFDEADALFGKRSDVKDSHDRYANVEVSYLLQRMEAYGGLAILTTNMKAALDPAFLRRIRFVVQFPFPDVPQRTEIWRRAFPSQTPTDRLDWAKLARLAVAGGNIRNMAMNAAFLAAEGGQPVRMAHVLEAARTECAKLDRPLTETEIGGWR